MVLESQNYFGRNEKHNYVCIFFLCSVTQQLHEVDMMMCEMLTPTELDCDVACLVYDVTNPRSFEFCARMYLVSITFELNPQHKVWDQDALGFFIPLFRWKKKKKEMTKIFTFTSVNDMMVFTCHSVIYSTSFTG